MSTQLLTIYQDITRNLLEDSGLQTLAIMSNQDFLNLYNDVIQDFLQRTGCIKKDPVIPAVYDVGTYPEPDNAMDVQIVYLDNAHINRSSGWYLDNFDSSWQVESGTVERWREDELPPKSIQFDPIPLIQGRQVATTPTNFGFGQIAAVSSPVDFNIVGPPTGGYGIINGGSGNLPSSTNGVYLEAVTSGYGTTAEMNCTNSNIQIVATMQPLNPAVSIYDYVYVLPDSFTIWIKYGILAKIWSGDGEYKDAQRGNWAMQRFQEGISWVSGIMGDIGAQ